MYGWLSAGVGAGELGHHDVESEEPALRRWSRAPLEIRTVAAGVGTELGTLGNGTLHARGRVERFRIETPGGDAISRDLAPARGTLWQAGMDWRGAGEGLHPHIGAGLHHADGDAPGGSHLALEGGVEPWLGSSGRVRLRAGASIRTPLGSVGRTEKSLDLGLSLSPRRNGRGLSATLGVGRTVVLDAEHDAPPAALTIESAYRFRRVEPFVGMHMADGARGPTSALGVRLHGAGVDRVSLTAVPGDGDRRGTLRAQLEHRF